jgi:hypothetical protein
MNIEATLTLGEDEIRELVVQHVGTAGYHVLQWDYETDPLSFTCKVRPLTKDEAEEMGVVIETPDERVYRILEGQLAELVARLAAPQIKLRTPLQPTFEAEEAEDTEEEERSSVTQLTGFMGAQAIETSRTSKARLRQLREEIDKNNPANVIEQVEAFEEEQQA